MIFGGNYLTRKHSYDLIRRFLNVPIYIKICLALGDVLDLAEVVFQQKREIKFIDDKL